ncbi:BnaAnng29650D, partial [Brassica napus]
HLSLEFWKPGLCSSFWRRIRRKSYCTNRNKTFKSLPVSFQKVQRLSLKWSLVPWSRTRFLNSPNLPRYSVIVLGLTTGYDDADGEHPKPTQYSAVSRRLASRSNYDGDDATTMAYYDARKSLEQDRKKATFLFSKKKGRMFSRRREAYNIFTVEMPM